MKRFHDAIFWMLSLTWGLPLTVVGLLTGAYLVLIGHKTQRFHAFVYFTVEGVNGGVNLGPVFVIGKGPSESIKWHEAGHGLQNVMFGMLFIPLIGIPSLIRCKYRTYRRRKDPDCKLPLYDAIWFERQAAELGDRYFRPDYNMWDTIPCRKADSKEIHS